MAAPGETAARDLARPRQHSLRPMSRWVPPRLLVRSVVALGLLLPPQWSCVGHPKPATTSQSASATPSVDLHLASLQGNVGAVREHAAAGSNLDARDAYGSTPLTVATTFGRTEVVQALLDAGADPNLADQKGSAPLHIAAFLGHPDIVQALLKHDADKRARNFTGATAFDIVAAPFAPDRPVYDELGAALGPIGLHLDYAELESSRPVIAELLRARPEELTGVNYAPEQRGDFPVSTPAEQGLAPQLVAELFVDAAAVQKLVGLLVVKNGRLVAEGYYNEGSIDHRGSLQSVTKSVTSALVGLALDRGCLSSLDQKMLEFFPAQAARVDDPRKRQITVRQMLEMRAGYPWEETDDRLWQVLGTGAFFDPVVDFALVNDPGAAFNYSNLTSHWLGVVAARACKTDLMSFAEQNLFSPLGIQPGVWFKDRDGYYVGLAGLHLTGRDMAKFGLLYLARGTFAGKRVLPAAWVGDSLRSYSQDAWIAQPPQHHAGRYFRELGYGYQWWSAEIGVRSFNFAWGHGGQLIVLLGDLDMVIVAMSYPFTGQHDDESWRHERATLNLVGKFIRSLPPS